MQTLGCQPHTPHPASPAPQNFLQDLTFSQNMQKLKLGGSGLHWTTLVDCLNTQRTPICILLYFFSQCFVPKVPHMHTLLLPIVFRDKYQRLQI